MAGNATTKKDANMDLSMKIDGQSIPLVGLGTYGMTGRSGINGIIDAIDIGYRHFDTAQMYRNEREVGEGIRQSGISREEVFITTKISAYNLEPEAIDSSSRQSIENLATEYADLLLIHWPTPGMDLESCLSAMVKLREEGLTRHIGVSNFSPDLFIQALAIAPVICNQVEFSPYVGEFKNLEIAKNKNLMLTAYSPLGKGRTGRDARLSRIGDKYGKTASQTALRWLLQLGNVSIIPKASNEKHRRENFDIFDFELDEEDMALVSPGS